MRPGIKRRAITGLAAAAVLLMAACGDDNGSDSDAEGAVTLVVYDSYPDDASEPNPLQVALAEFTEETGIEVELLKSQDAGTMVSKAVLTAGNPEGDVMWGIDNTLLSRAVEADVFEPYESPAADGLPDEFTALVPDGEATPVDYGDVCVNYDIAALQGAGVEPPATLADLTRPEYADMLAVENAATSSPGLAFLLGTIAEFGEDGWEAYWRDLIGNGALVVDSWNDAYYAAFTRAGGDRPLVVSYGSSPPFEVLFSPEPLSEAPTGVAAATCFRQIEFAGILRGTDAPESARALIDFLVSERYQREVPMNLFVFPVNPDVELAPEFEQFATIPDDPLSLDPAEIDANRADWIDRWTAIVTD
jgi:thiamine transport system substrate-binding protein